MTGTKADERERAGASGPGRAGAESRARSLPVARAWALRPRIGTLLALGLAGVAVTLAWADPFYEPDEGVLMVNNRSGGRRVFPTLVDADPSKAIIELQAPNEPLVRIVPTAGGSHQLLHGDVVLGPVADEDFEGLWSSLRLATARRTAGKGQGVGQRGVIRVSLPDQNLTLALGDAAPGGGVYGAFEVDGDTWVVETEMLTLVEQAPRSWLSKRLLPIDVGLVTRLAWGDELIVGRGDDGFWRVREGATPAMLATEAVEFRVRRLLRAQLDPLIERETVESESLRPWLVITTIDDSSRALQVGGACPGVPDRRLVDRGPGLLGCVPAKLLERWPLLEPEAGMLEPRLVPHDYARIVGVDLERPGARKLMRRGGEWLYSGEGEAGVEALAEEEVRRWYQALGRLEVAIVEGATGGGKGDGGKGEGAEGQGDGDQGEGEGEVPEGDWTLVVHADTGDRLRVSCTLEREPVICRRDDGPRLRVLGELPSNLAFDVETFAPRRLTEIGPGEIRELEILPMEGSATVRQSVHSDLGAWQLDAPTHVDDSGVIDEVRLESVLWALRQLRAEAWVEAPSSSALRRLNAEVVPERGLRRTVSVRLYPDCVVEVEGQRPALVGAAECAALSEDLFFDDPLRFLLERSRGVEIRHADGATVFVRRRDEQFVTSEGRPLEDEDMQQRLRDWIEWRSAGLRAGPPPGPVEWSLDVRRDMGPQAQIEIGSGWARLRGADWYYEQRVGDDEADGPEGTQELAPPDPIDSGLLEP